MDNKEYKKNYIDNIYLEEYLDSFFKNKDYNEKLHKELKKEIKSYKKIKIKDCDIISIYDIINNFYNERYIYYYKTINVIKEEINYEGLFKLVRYLFINKNINYNYIINVFILILLKLNKEDYHYSDYFSTLNYIEVYINRFIEDYLNKNMHFIGKYYE